jgi:hypothetical protein
MNLVLAKLTRCEDFLVPGMDWRCVLFDCYESSMKLK